MYVEPSTDVYILKNCPLESSYEHTVIFDSKEKQEAYFLSLAKFHPTAGDEHQKATYQRVNLNAIKIELPVAKLYDCNYMMFKNEYFENKWFYAFITSVEYVNNRTSLINYYVDVIQTWFFEAKLQKCFVEREHVTDDRIGANTVPENLDLGDSMIYHYMGKADGFSWAPNSSGIGDYVIEIITAFDRDGNKSVENAGLYGGVYSGLNYLYYSNIESAKNYINGVVKNSGEDAVIGLYMIPKQFVTRKGEPVRKFLWSVDVSYASSWKYAWESAIESPRNNKLYTAPFTNIICNNMIGGMIDYKVEDLCWESTEGRDENGEIKWVDREKYLDTKKEKFYYTLEGIGGAPPKCLLMPSHYAGQEYARNQQLTIDNFPQCAFITDSYRAWVAMNYRSMNVAGIASFANALSASVADIAIGRPWATLQNITGTATTIAEMYAEREKAKILPDKEHGLTAPELAMANDTLGFRFYCSHIRPEIAKRIDDYFDRYGYQVNVSKVPERKARKHWSYVKTADCTLTGDVPDDDKQKIITIYNRGITFWVHPEEVGDYSLDNRLDEDKRIAHLEPEWVEDPPFEDLMFDEDGFIKDTVADDEVEKNAISVYNFLKKQGWTNGAIIGAIANMDYYSGIDPAYNRDGKHGLLLWSGTRKDNLFSYLDTIGQDGSGSAYPHDSAKGQLLYIDTMSNAMDEWQKTVTYNVEFETFKNPPSWGDAVRSAKCFYRDYMHGESEAVEAKISERADYWYNKISKYSKYQTDSTDDISHVEPTDPESGTGSSSRALAKINPTFIYSTKSQTTRQPLTIEQKQTNARAIYNLLTRLGWSDNAIYAVIGNFDVTSGLDPSSEVNGHSEDKYAYGQRIGFAHWYDGRLKNLTNYLIKYNYIHWYTAEDNPDWIEEHVPDWILDRLPQNPSFENVIFLAGSAAFETFSNGSQGGPAKGQVVYLHDKGGKEWVNSSKYNVTFDKFRKNNTASLEHLTNIFNYNYMRGTHSDEDTADRIQKAKYWANYLAPLGGGEGGGGR